MQRMTRVFCPCWMPSLRIHLFLCLYINHSWQVRGPGPPERDENRGGVESTAHANLVCLRDSWLLGTHIFTSWPARRETVAKLYLDQFMELLFLSSFSRVLKGRNQILSRSCVNLPCMDLANLVRKPWVFNAWWTVDHPNSLNQLRIYPVQDFRFSQYLIIWSQVASVWHFELFCYFCATLPACHKKLSA